MIKKHRTRGKTQIAVPNNLSVSRRAMEETAKSIRYMNECLDLLRKDHGEEYEDLFMFSLNLAGYHKISWRRSTLQNTREE